MNKIKIFNDPVYGFVTIPFELIFDIIEHPYFQRLRRIQQLGLGSLVYPGAIHTRFQHALGAVHLAGNALRVLRSKGHQISEEEARSVSIAILLHDIGHGPFSHALEKSIVGDVHHENLSLLFMERLNEVFSGQICTAIEIFKGKYPRKFLNQLVSSQLDVDRLDYLARDSYFTGVHEGVIGYNRIIEMMDIHNDELVIEAKGIYSIEKFLIARRLMYWQVYLHKTVLCAEEMLVKALARARFLLTRGETVFTTPALEFFLTNNVTELHFLEDPVLIDRFTSLDDYDILASLKVWENHKDPVLKRLSYGLINRKLFKIQLQNEPIEDEVLEEKINSVMKLFAVNREDASFLAFKDFTSNSAYDKHTDMIKIKDKKGRIQDVAAASDQLNIQVLSDTVIKHYICYPKET